MRLPINRFKAALLSPRPQFGLWLSLASPIAAEICATAAFDWLLIDGEHGPNELASVMAQLRVASADGPSMIVRSADGTRRSIEPLLDAGAQTIMVPQVEDAEQAGRIAAAFAYPPAGDRGIAIGSIRASRWGAVDDYLGRARGELCVVAQIESGAGLANVAAIAATPGIDALFVGPNDLAASLGLAGQVAHPGVQDAISRIAREGTAAGIPLGILATDVAAARRHVAQGFRFVGLGSDAGLLAKAARALALDAHASPDPSVTRTHNRSSS